MIAAVVILFNPDLYHTSGLIKALKKQVDLICLVDNSLTDNEEKLSIDENENITYQHFPNNIGIAKAQNYGLHEVSKQGADYAILFDQDSYVSDALIERLFNCFQSARNVSNPIAIGPQILCSHTKKQRKARVQKKLRRLEKSMDLVSQIISSGMLIDLEKFFIVGDKRDELFIDAVDHEWCWRARNKGFDIVKAHNLEMLHPQGDKSRSFLGLSYKVGSPIRLYYQFRNVLLLRKYSHVPKYWLYRNLAVMPFKFFAMSLVEDNRLLRTKYMCKGVLDGLKNNSGKINKEFS